MQIKLNFLGAAQNVTGSRHLVEYNGEKVLIDCGLYQERQFKERNWAPFTVDPAGIDAVILSHAHLDHCGLLPKLVKDGFCGKIYCTPATAEIAKVILLDSAKIQQEDAEHKRYRHEKQNRVSPYPVVPLYTVEDAEMCFPLFSPIDYRESFSIGEHMEATLYDAGHVLGSAIIRVKVRDGDNERIILYSGDIGRPGGPIVCDATVFDKADYVLIESTYGDRSHKEVDIRASIAEIINSTVKKGGNIVIPSFALERSQEMLYYLNELMLEKKIPRLNIFLDSPMASRITKIFINHPELFDEQMSGFILRHNSPFNLPELRLAGMVEESMAINDEKGPSIIIAGSGMCTGGRIKYHLVNNISRPESTIMFVGYQAVGTLGRSIVDGAQKVRILGEKRDVLARIERIYGFSAHADQDELFNWLNELDTPPRKLFVVHGESDSAKHFASFVKKRTDWDVEVPEYGNEFILD